MNYHKRFLFLMCCIFCFSCIENTSESKNRNTKKSDIPKIDTPKIPREKRSGEEPSQDTNPSIKKEQQSKRKAKDTLKPIRVKP